MRIPANISAQAFGKVAVLLGGESAEREVSLSSGEAILSGLQAYGINAHAFDTKYRDICELSAQGFDRVFIALHGRGGEDGSIQGTLEQLKIPYTGTGVAGSVLAIDKVLSKLVWDAKGFPIAKYIVINKQTFAPNDAEKILSELGDAVMVKPSLEGSSLGMSKAQDISSLLKAIEQAFQYDDTVLIEKFIDGPEYTVTLLGDRALPSISMRSESGFYDYHAKYKANTTQYDCPSGLNPAEESHVQQLALSAFAALQGKTWGRIDLMRDTKSSENDVDPLANFYLLESNTVPGMTKTSLVPKAAKQAGIEFEQLVVMILADTLVSSRT